MARYARGERVSFDTRPDEELEIVRVIERPTGIARYEVRLPNHRVVGAAETELVPAEMRGTVQHLIERNAWRSHDQG